jgi:hypothetical protein
MKLVPQRCRGPATIPRVPRERASEEPLHDTDIADDEPGNCRGSGDGGRTSSSASNGRRPVSASTSMTLTKKMSAR